MKMFTSLYAMAQSNKGHFLLSLLASDGDSIMYRPKLVEITGSVNAAILFTMIVILSSKHNRQPFMKFRIPCNSKNYRVGTSWTEITGMTKYEFDSAIKSIGHKIEKGGNVDYDALVFYYTDGDRQTWYKLNIPKVIEKLTQLYMKDHVDIADTNVHSPENLLDTTEKSKNFIKVGDKMIDVNLFTVVVHNEYKRIAPGCQITPKVITQIRKIIKEKYTTDDFKKSVDNLIELLEAKNSDGSKKYFRSYKFLFVKFLSQENGFRQFVNLDLSSYLSNDRKRSTASNPAKTYGNHSGTAEQF